MKCEKCGFENPDTAKHCSECGETLACTESSNIQAPNNIIVHVDLSGSGGTPQPAPVVQSKPVTPLTESGKTLAFIAFIFNLFTTITMGCLTVFPICWQIPMTAMSWGVYKGTRELSTAFGVCTLIFVNPVSGILLLCAKPPQVQ